VVARVLGLAASYTSVCVCVSIRRPYCIKTAARIELLLFCIHVSLDERGTYCVLSKLGYLQNKGTSSKTLDSLENLAMASRPSPNATNWRRSSTKVGLLLIASGDDSGSGQCCQHRPIIVICGCVGVVWYLLEFLCYLNPRRLSISCCIWCDALTVVTMWLWYVWI